MKKKTKFTLLLPALLALLLALVPSEALKPQEVHAAKAPRLNVVMASESGFVVELLAQDTMTLSAFGGKTSNEREYPSDCHSSVNFILFTECLIV